MKFTLSWLNSFVSTEGIEAQQLADKLTMLGLEVDAVHPLYEGLGNIVIAKVLDCNQHPTGDKLTLCSVDNGTEIVQVVCGAPNVRKGMISAIAKPGVRLPNGTKIKKAKVRGEVSFGMLCSARELGLSEDHTGILDLDTSLIAGQPLDEALDLKDFMVEVDLTPNRPDCTSVIGIAREVSGFTGNPLNISSKQSRSLSGAGLDYTVSIDEPDLCPRYAARKLTKVTIGPSPSWMQQRLLEVGQRPINNIVDITNYVMLEMGQPLHAFDFRKLGGKAIIVRRPRSHETQLTTLDGSKRDIDSEMLMICDAEQPVAVAGVMGGLDSEVTDSTSEILLESACFNPISIRRTARKLNLPSEASYRFERGVDPNLADSALDRAVELMVEYCGAVAEPDGIDLYPGKCDLQSLNLRVDKVCSLLGIEISAEKISDYLKGIDFEIIPVGPNLLEVIVPSFRVDIEREIDLVEEVARLVGYNEIPTTLPSIGMNYPMRDELRILRKKLASVATAQGFYEAINYSFVNSEHLDMCRLTVDDERRLATTLLNPLNEEQSIMRTMLLPGLLENIRRNINFQQTDIRLYEIGKTFRQGTSKELPEESFDFCAVISGIRYPNSTSLYFAEDQADIFDLKGIAENIITSLRLTGNDAPLSIAPDSEKIEPYCESGMYLSIRDGSKEIGRIGALASEVLKNFSIKQAVFFLELDLQKTLVLKKMKKAFTSLPKYPSVKRDIALLVPDSVPAGTLLQSIREQDYKFVESTDIFDVYHGKPITEGFKSVALSVTYRSASKTLNERSVEKVHKKIVNSLMSDFNARYREGSEE